MATYLLDTNAFSALMDEHPRAVARAEAVAQGDRIVICTIVRGEIKYGLERMPEGRKRRDFETKAGNLFAKIACEPIPMDVADVYARIKRDAERAGAPLDENDLWIAATALDLGAVLVSADSDFRRIRGLTTEDWTQ